MYHEEGNMRQYLKDSAALPTRLILGFGFAFHGYGKLFSAEGHAGFVGMLRGIGVPAPEITAWLVGTIEFFGGIALILGAFVSVVAVLQIGVMVVALFTVHLGAGFNFMNIVGMSEAGPQFGIPGFEINLLYIAGLSALLLGGAGALSVDRLLATVAARRIEPAPIQERAAAVTS
jgi:putative oxidoreductase